MNSVEVVAFVIWDGNMNNMAKRGVSQRMIVTQNRQPDEINNHSAEGAAGKW